MGQRDRACPVFYFTGMKRLIVIILIAGQAAELHAAMWDLSLLRDDDITAAGTPEYVSQLGSGTTARINFSKVANALDTIVLSGVEWQATAYWSINGKLCLGVRKNRGNWTTYEYNGARGLDDIACANTADAHYAVSMAIDESGIIHVGGNAHADVPMYRRSDAAITSWTGGLTANQEILGSVPEETTSYLQFFRGRNDAGFFCSYRSGISSTAKQILAEWNGSTWTAADGTTTDGVFINDTSTPTGVYVGRFEFSSDWDNAGTGYMHCFWNWNSSGGDGQNWDISHVRWNGTTFSQMGGSQTIPISTSNNSVVESIASSNVLISWPGSAVAPSGAPHATYTYGSATQLLRHAYWNGSSWTVSTVRTGASAAPTDFSSPDILIDDAGQAHIVYQNRGTDDYEVTYSAGTNYTSWSNATILDANDTEWWTCNRDRWAWDELNRLDALIPYATTPTYITNGLVVYLPLDESSAGSADVSRYDNIFGSAFTDSNSTPSATGIIGLAANTNGSNELIYHVDSALLSITSNLTIDCWVNLDTEATTQFIVGKWNPGGNDRSYALFYNTSADRFEFQVSSSGTAATTATVTATNAGAVSTATWYHVVGWFDDTANEINISVNGSSETATAFASTIENNTSAFAIGSVHGGGSYLDGKCDEVGLWNRVLSAGERTKRYNSGNGYAFQPMGTFLPWIYSHGATASVDVDAGDTAVATVRAYGDLTMGETLTGTDAADFNVTDNGDGTWALAFDSAATAGTYTVTLTLDNAAGSDATDFTVNVAGTGNGLLRTIILLSQFDRQHKQQSHFDRYGVYAITP